jgi:23S rRNA pseudouridine1911/1915/1917 synthase
VKALIESRRVTLADGRTIEEPSRKVKTGECFVVDIPGGRTGRAAAAGASISISFTRTPICWSSTSPPAWSSIPRRAISTTRWSTRCSPIAVRSLSGIGGVRRPGIVHRLDKDTSGVMVVAKNDFAHRALSKLFASHDLTRIYRALVWGGPKQKAGTIDGGDRPPSGRPQAHGPCAPAAAGPRHRVLGRAPVSGRRSSPSPACSAQSSGPDGPIRSASISPTSAVPSGRPGLRDERPGTTAAPASLKKLQADRPLHAAILEFRHPRTGKEMRFATELPQDSGRWC